MKRRKGSEPSDPVFAAEMAALAEARRGDTAGFKRAWDERFARRVDVPPEMRPTPFHRHDDGCWSDEAPFVTRTNILKRFCRTAGQWIHVREATPDEARRAYAVGRMVDA